MSVSVMPRPFPSNGDSPRRMPCGCLLACIHLFQRLTTSAFPQRFSSTPAEIPHGSVSRKLRGAGVSPAEFLQVTRIVDTNGLPLP